MAHEDLKPLRYMEDYHTVFDPKTYLDLFYSRFKGNEYDDGSVQFFVKCYHEFWSIFEAAETGAQVRHLEYGGGPCITNLVSACPKLDHIVFAEYTEANRQALKSWIAGSPEAHDWTPLLEFIIGDLEPCASHVTFTPREENISLAIEKRTEEIKKKIKSIIPCDVTKVPIVQLEPEDIGRPFDVVSTSLCLEACVSSEAHYKNVVAELSQFLKPNGYLFMNGVLEQTFYFVGKEKFYTFPLTEKIVKEAMNEAGIKIAEFETFPTNYSVVSNCKALFYTYGRKCVQQSQSKQT